MNDIHKEVVVVKKPIWEPYSVANWLTGGKAGNQGLVSKDKKAFKPRIVDRIRANYFIPDPRKFWVKPSIRFLKQYISEHNIQYLVTTGPPHSMHLIGEGLKKDMPALKWIVDIRDPWSRFDFLKSFGSSQRALKKQAGLEKKVLEAADKVIATSFQMKELLVDFDSAKFSCITNGFDPEDFEGFEDVAAEDELIIYHAGLLNSVRNPVNLWKALSALCRSNKTINKRLKIHLVGVVDEDISEQLKAYPEFEGKMKIEAYKPHDAVIRDYGNADVLLLLVNNTDNAAANIPGKLFEYIATDKSILIVSEDDSDAHQLLQNYANHYHVHYDLESVVDLDTLESFLLQSNKHPAPDPEFKSSFDRRNLTSKLVNLLLEL